jgi:hypothetical protein
MAHESINGENNNVRIHESGFLNSCLKNNLTLLSSSAKSFKKTFPISAAFEPAAPNVDSNLVVVTGSMIISSYINPQIN